MNARPQANPSFSAVIAAALALAAAVALICIVAAGPARAQQPRAVVTHADADLVHRRTEEILKMPFIPVGTVVGMYLGQVPPDFPGKWLPCDGREIPVQNEELRRIYNDHVPNMNHPMLITADRDDPGVQPLVERGPTLTFYVRAVDDRQKKEAAVVAAVQPEQKMQPIQLVQLKIDQNELHRKIRLETQLRENTINSPVILPGTIVAFRPGEMPPEPEKWLECDGREISDTPENQKLIDLVGLATPDKRREGAALGLVYFIRAEDWHI